MDEQAQGCCFGSGNISWIIGASFLWILLYFFNGPYIWHENVIFT